MLPYLYIGPFTIPSYGFCMTVGIIVACLVALYRVRVRGGNFDSLLMVTAVAFAIGLCCAKIAYYVFSYGIGRLFCELKSGDFSGFSDAGLVYYGGLIGGVIGALLAIKLNRYDFDIHVNAITPCVPLGHAFGRIGCLFAGCCYGMPYDGRLAVHSVFVDSQQMLFPIQAVESVCNIALFVILILYTKKSKKGLQTLSLYLVSYSVIRFVIEFFRGDLIRGIYWGLSTSQWISVLIILTCLFCNILNRKAEIVKTKNS